MKNIKNIKGFKEILLLIITIITLLTFNFISNAKDTTTEHKHYYLKNVKPDSSESKRIEKLDSIYMKQDLFNLDTLNKSYKDHFYIIKTQTVGASFYHYKFHGRRTANGERFNINALTAAHKKLPFNTLIRVTNMRNDSSVILRINDRGPFIKGRELDLTHEASRRLQVRGVLKVRMEVLKSKTSLF